MDNMNKNTFDVLPNLDFVYVFLLPEQNKDKLRDILELLENGIKQIQISDTLRNSVTA